MKIVSVVGARPQFIKAAPFSSAFRVLPGHTEVLIHTGQHYDENMSTTFFNELDMLPPAYNLNVGSALHGEQTGLMMAGIEKILIKERPDCVLVYGDTNSTLAGALSATKLHLKVAHIEAGLRSGNKTMAEEINRILVDHVSDILFCPSQASIQNLAAEGIREGVYLTGDIMRDALEFALRKGLDRSTILQKLNVDQGHYLVATVHRAENTDDPSRLGNIFRAFELMEEPIIFPLHPRTKKALQTLGYSPSPNVRLIEPLGYMDMTRLSYSARLIMTDSGGLQKEAYWLGVPCVTLREETEWVETVEAGWNVLVGVDVNLIVDATKPRPLNDSRPELYSDTQATPTIIETLLRLVG